jgi:hypothetical protein
LNQVWPDGRGGKVNQPRECLANRVLCSARIASLPSPINGHRNLKDAGNNLSLAQKHLHLAAQLLRIARRLDRVKQSLLPIEVCAVYLVVEAYYPATVFFPANKEFHDLKRGDLPGQE